MLKRKVDAFAQVVPMILRAVMACGVVMVCWAVDAGAQGDINSTGFHHLRAHLVANAERLHNVPFFIAWVSGWIGPHERDDDRPANTEPNSASMRYRGPIEQVSLYHYMGRYLLLARTGHASEPLGNAPRGSCRVYYWDGEVGIRATCTDSLCAAVNPLFPHQITSEPSISGTIGGRWEPLPGGSLLHAAYRGVFSFGPDFGVRLREWMPAKDHGWSILSADQERLEVLHTRADGIQHVRGFEQQSGWSVADKKKLPNGPKHMYRYLQIDSVLGTLFVPALHHIEWSKGSDDGGAVRQLEIQELRLMTPSQFDREMEGRAASLTAAIRESEAQTYTRLSDEGLARGSLLCGPQALSRLLKLTDSSRGFRDILDLFEIGDDGVSFADLERAGKALGLTLDGIRYGTRDIAAIESAAILHFDGSHFVLLEKVVQGAAKIHDGLHAPALVDLSRLWERWSGAALVLRSPDVPAYEGPELVALESTVLLGGVPAHTPLPVAWTIANLGTEDLSVSAHSDDSELQPEIDSLLLRPGEEGMLHFTLVPPSSGLIYHEIVLDTDDVLADGSRLAVSGFVLPPSPIGPTNLHLGIVTLNSTRERVMRFPRPHGAVTEDNLVVEVSDENLAAYIEYEGDGSKRLHVRFSSASGGAYEGLILVKGSSVIVRVFAEVVPRFRPIPSVLPLGVVAADAEIEVTVAILADSLFEVLDVRTDHHWVAVQGFRTVAHDQGTTIYARLLCGPTPPDIAEGNLLVTIAPDGEDDRVVGVPMLGLRLPQPVNDGFDAVVGSRP